MLRTSSGGSQDSGGAWYLRPSISAARSTGCHRRL